MSTNKSFVGSTDSSDKQWKSRFTDMLNDPDFDRLELGISLPNIFAILGASRQEIRHSFFLSWIFDPQGSHGLGDLFLRRFLRDVLADNKAIGYTQFDADLFDLHEVEIRREWKRIDILIVHAKFVILIENKVDSHDHSNQLKRYRDKVEHFFPHHEKIFVYMTPFGSEPRDAEAGISYCLYSYEQLSTTIATVLDVHRDRLSPKVYSYLQDYQTILRRELMSSDQMNELAVKIYKAHREALDFLFENRPDAATELQVYFEAKVKQNNWVLGSPNKGYVRFLTPALAPLIPKGYSKGWPWKESFLFEIDYYWSNKDVVFKTVIAPGNDEINSILNTSLERTPGHKVPTGKHWLVHFSKRWPFVAREMIEQSDETIRSAIDKFWPEIQDIVDKVESSIIADADKLKKFSP